MAKPWGYWEDPVSIPLSKVRNRHSLTRGHVVKRRYASQPIRVFPRRGLLGGTTYVIHDGHHRVRDARAAGRGSIRAQVWHEVGR